ncbi:hypothetical protein [Paraburkholderia saeva]|uniref:hypothetical protein n=1 Tax=Paraburkholderia saeva TaxID=2777537 RepID=UPI001DCB2023|nr:hypothetical protein [Paraburkholderia saeva]CAG4903952.1 hypothetical protein R52603_03148 [Paraburkholderia saeva]
MKITPPDRSTVHQPASNGTVDAAVLISGIKQSVALAPKMQRPDDLVNTFTGNFQQLAKCEMGTPAFLLTVASLPGCFLLLSTALSSRGGGAVTAFMNGAGWPQMTIWLGQHAPLVSIPNVQALLLQWDQALGSAANARNLAGQLIQALLLPVLEAL